MTNSNNATVRDAAVRTLAMPADTNSAGDIFGGWLVSQMDIAGEITARQYARRRVVTVAIDRMEFHKPVYVGDIVSCYADVTNVGKSSLAVSIEAVATRGTTGETVKVTEGVFTFVALGDDGRPCKVERVG